MGDEKKYVEVNDLEVGDYVTVWDVDGEFGRQTVMAVDDLQYLPSADVRPVVRGQWEATDAYMTDKCTNCGFLMDWDDIPAWLEELPHFKSTCPNCGADMREKTLDKSR